MQTNDFQQEKNRSLACTSELKIIILILEPIAVAVDMVRKKG